jgi:hypothetical protein
MVYLSLIKIPKGMLAALNAPRQNLAMTKTRVLSDSQVGGSNKQLKSNHSTGN